MPETNLSGADRFLIGLATVTDAVSVLSFLGIHPTIQLRWIVVGTLTFLGIMSSGVTLASSVALWLSPKGSLYRPGYHSRKIVIGLSALVVSILGVFLTSEAIHAAHPKPQPNPTSSSAPAKSLRPA